MAKPFPKMDPGALTPPAPPQATTKAFTVLRKAGGWVMITYTFQGDQLVHTESTEPDLKVLALEAFKLAAYKYWTSQ